MPTRAVKEFIVQPLGRSPDTDAALEQLLHEAFVPAGFTEPARAAALFGADAIHARGRTLAARWPHAGRTLAARWPHAGRTLAARWPRETPPAHS
jgi:hypothetical protein